MKLIDILSIFNITHKQSLTCLRRSVSVSSFSPGIKEQSIELFDTNLNKAVFTVKEKSIVDVSETLEEKVIEFLFNFTRNIHNRIICIDLATIPKGMSIEDVVSNWEKLQNIIPIKIVELNGNITI